MPLSSTAASGAPAAADPLPPLPAYAFLKPREAAFAEALADQMVPADHLTPSGTALGITIYIDRTLGGAWGAGEGLYAGGPWQRGTPAQGYQLPLTPAQLFRAGVEAVDAYLARLGSGGFASLDGAGKDQLLSDLEKGGLDLGGVDGPALFALLYQLVVEGLFADPIHGGNRDMAGWRLLGFPGVVAVHARNVGAYKDKPYPVRFFSIADAS